MTDLSHHGRCPACGQALPAGGQWYDAGPDSDQTLLPCTEGTDGSGSAAAYCILGAIFTTLVLVIWWALS